MPIALMLWQVAQQTAQAVPATPSEANAMLNQVTASAVVVFVIQQLKKSRGVTWITSETEKFNHLVAVCAAFFVSIGIHLTFDSSAGILTITGLTFWGIAKGLWHWLQSYAVQQSIYRATVYRSPEPAVVKSSAASAGG